MHASQPRLRFSRLSKRYGEHILFHALHYSAGAGCVAISDESGSGKSTLLAILAGAITPDEGEVWIGGHSLLTAPAAAQSTLAYIPDDCMTHPQQTGREYLNQVAAARKTTLDSRALELAHRFDLAPHLDKRFEQMSLGTRKKIFLSAAALGEPAVVIADEPGAGLDAAARAVLAELFNTLGQDRAVWFSSYDTGLIQACGAKTVGFADLSASALTERPRPA
jgi:ABC-2 type transport system ATP-binding protein